MEGQGTDKATDEKDQAKPVDFIKEPSTERLKNKVDEWINTVLVRGTLRA